MYHFLTQIGFVNNHAQNVSSINQLKNRTTEKN